MLLTSLVADGSNASDIADAVRIGDTLLSRAELSAASAAVLKDLAGAPTVAVLATPTAQTVLAVTGCLLAGVPVVPVPADVGVAERQHILRDSGAQAWLGERPDDLAGLPHFPARAGSSPSSSLAEPPGPSGGPSFASPSS
ncbi:AMP-binding protein, partial [Mycobacterium sp. UM_WGJ]